MKYVIAWIVSNILYYTGHVISRLLRLPNSLHRMWWIGPVYRSYNKVMLLSADVSDWGNAGVWKKPKPVE